MLLAVWNVEHYFWKSGRSSVFNRIKAHLKSIQQFIQTGRHRKSEILTREIKLHNPKIKQDQEIVVALTWTSTQKIPLETHYMVVIIPGPCLKNL